MKRVLKGLIILASIAILYLPTNNILAYDPPGPPGDHGQNDDQEPNGGSAPIAGGLPVLVILGIAYGTKKYLSMTKV